MVLRDDLSDLLDLVRFGLAAGERLEVDDFLDAVAGEDVVAPLGAFVEVEGEKEGAELFEADVGVGTTGEDLLVGLP